MFDEKEQLRLWKTLITDKTFKIVIYPLPADMVEQQQTEGWESYSPG